MLRRTILEWETIRYGEASDAIPAWAADRLAAAAAASPLSGRGGGGVLEHGRKGLRARGVVGVIATDGCALEILPKIEVAGDDAAARAGGIRRRLVQMLAVALDMRIDDGRLTELECQRETLLEILIRLFSERLLDAVRHGMPRRYVAQAEDLAAMRGRLDAVRQATRFAAAPNRLACRFEDLSQDTPLNQVMKAAVTRLAKVARSDANQRRLRELAFAYADVREVVLGSLRWDAIVLDRTDGRWREPLNLARLLLGERFQTTSDGNAAGFSLLFEMNVLFEQYVARLLTSVLSGDGVRVVSQGGRLFCLETEERRGLFQTRPDILIKQGDAVVQVIDTKWKRIGARIDDAKQGVSQADVYQMIAYGQLYRCPRLTLLYPHHALIGREDGLLASHRIIGSEGRLETTTLDIGSTLRLKERVRGLHISDDGLAPSV